LEIYSTGEQGERGSETSESEYREDSTVITNKVPSDELTLDSLVVNQEEVTTLERRTTTRVRQPKMAI
jgi:hypothetical protein